MLGTQYGPDFSDSKDPIFSNSRDPLIIFSDSRDPIFNSMNPNRVPKHQLTVSHKHLTIRLFNHGLNCKVLMNPHK